MYGKTTFIKVHIVSYNSEANNNFYEKQKRKESIGLYCYIHNI